MYHLEISQEASSLELHVDLYLDWFIRVVFILSGCFICFDFE